MMEIERREVSMFTAKQSSEKLRLVKGNEHKTEQL